MKSYTGGGLDPKIWGNEGWKFIRYIIQGFDETTQHKRDICNFVNSLKDILPCEKCRCNFSKTIMKYPIEPYLANNDGLRWWHDIRDEVRNHEGGPHKTIDTLAIEAKYKNIYRDNNDHINDIGYNDNNGGKSGGDKLNTLFYISVILVIFGFGCFLYIYLKKRKQDDKSNLSFRNYSHGFTEQQQQQSY